MGPKKYKKQKQIKNQNKIIMDISGTIINISETKSGISKSGNKWSSAEYTLSFMDHDREKHFSFSVTGEKINSLNIQLGCSYKIYYDIDAHEYNGKWYNSFIAWKAESIKSK